MNQNKTILLVDDTETNIDILVGLLEDYDLVVALDGKSALKIIEEEKIDLILLDIMMPGIDGYEVCEKLKQNSNTKEVPVIFITAKTDENSIEKAYEVGGVDYVTKPFKPKELIARVKQQLKMQSLIEDLNYLASRDSLTGILNRRKFFELSLKLFKNSSELYAVMIDIDNFKKINDRYGHDIGDMVIIELTKTINSYLKEDEVFGRLGGEEFAIISPRLIEDRLNKILEKIQSTNLITEKNEIVQFTISSGISKKDEMKSLDDLLKIADNGLYKAKKSGKNRVVFRSS